MSKSKARFLADLLGPEGLVRASRSSLSGGDGIIDLGTLPTIPNNKLEHSSISIAGHTLSLGGTLTLDTSDIGEHESYLYYTDARARSAISVSGSGSYDSATGVITITGDVSSVNSQTGEVSLDTDDISEGISNFYFTDARARAAISVTGSGSYNSETGVITITGGVSSVNSQTGEVSLDTDDISEGATNLYYTSARANTDFDTRLGTKSTTDLSEGTNLYYTDTRVGSYLTTNSYATESYVGTQIANLVDTAPTTLDTLNELAAALGDDANFSTTVTNSIATKWTQDNTKISNWDTAYGWGNHASAGYLTGNQTITLTGDVSGSGTTSITVTIADDSHNHVISNVDGLQTALDGKLPLSGGTISGDLTVTGTILWQVSGADAARQRADARDDATNFSRLHWYGMSDTGATSNFRHAWYDGAAYIDVSANSSGRIDFTGSAASMYIGSDRVFDDGYHPNADKWTTSRTLSLSGDASGSVSWDGSANATLSVAVGNDSHTHNWANITSGSRTNYSLSFRPPASNYAGFQFLNDAGSNAGYLLVRSTASGSFPPYTAGGITLVSDVGGLNFFARGGTQLIRMGTGNSETFRLESNYSLSLTSSRAPIFYDSNNTGYYTDPASTSVLNNLRYNPAPGSISTESHEGSINYVYNSSGGTPTRGDCSVHVYHQWSSNLSLSLTNSSWQRGDIVRVSNVRGTVNITVSASRIYLPNGSYDTSVTFNGTVGGFVLAKYSTNTGYWMVLPT